MPGFSRRDQSLLARLVLAHRGKLERVQPLTRVAPEWLLIFCLRLAALLHRARTDAQMPEIQVSATANGFQLQIDRDWLDNAPMTAAVLAEETQQWTNVGIEFKLRGRRMTQGESARG